MTFKLTIFIQFRNSPYYLSATYKLARRETRLQGESMMAGDDNRKSGSRWGTEESARPGTYKRRYSQSRREVAK